MALEDLRNKYKATKTSVTPKSGVKKNFGSRRKSGLEQKLSSTPGTSISDGTTLQAQFSDLQFELAEGAEKYGILTSSFKGLLNKKKSLWTKKYYVIFILWWYFTK